MPSSAFFDHVRGRTDALPEGYSQQGMRVYRHLVHLGASQVLEAHFPAVRQALGEHGWHTLIDAFVQQSAWSSHHLGDLHHDFTVFLAHETARPETNGHEGA
ncbi:MAG: putative DNA-binding domain-containing protein [Aquabacterium sp.]